MASTRLRGRYIHILTFFAGVISRFILWDIVLRRIGFRRWVRRNRTERLRREATRFRVLALSMGGVMIKVGQFLSSRLDVLPREVTDELANLQDEVPAEDFQAEHAPVEAVGGVQVIHVDCRLDDRFYRAHNRLRAGSVSPRTPASPAGSLGW